MDLKIAFFTYRFPVRSEAFIMNAAAGLLRAGHQLDIYALHGAGDFDAQEFVEKIGADSRFRLIVFKDREKPRRRLALAPLVSARLLARHGAKGLRAADRRWFGTDGPNLVALHEAGMFRKNGQYDVLHCQFGTLAEPVLNHRDAGFLSGRVFVHFRGYDISSYISSHGGAAYGDVFRRADGFLTNCDYFRRRLLEAGSPADRTTVVPSPVDTELFQYRENVWKPGEKLRVLCVGRLVEKKGFEFALKSLADLRARGLHLECRIIGAGPLLQSLQAQAASLGIADCVSFTGAGTQSDIASALREAHIFLAPSVRASNGDEDASINTLKEAMAAGCVFVSTDHGGIPELVDGLDAGWLAPERDASALCEGLTALLARANEWPQMGRRARARIVTKYSVKAATDLTLRVYNTALAPPANARASAA